MINEPNILIQILGELKVAMSGGSALASDIQEFFCLIGLSLMEGYGLTETSPIIATTNYGITKKQIGGMTALPGVEIGIFSIGTTEKLAVDEEGEVCCAGDNVMVGYITIEFIWIENFYYLLGRISQSP